MSIIKKMKLFLQPFPHRIFTAADMLSTLADLGLSPSGSLVVKKKDQDQASTGTGESDISKSVLQWNPVNTDTKGTCDGVLFIKWESILSKLSVKTSWKHGFINMKVKVDIFTFLIIYCNSNKFIIKKPYDQAVVSRAGFHRS